MKHKILLTLFPMLLIVLLASTAYAAVLQGIVYDLDLKPVLGAVVEIDTVPKQRMVVMNGTYSFSVPSGNYKIKASYTQDGIVQYSTEESIKISDDGEYVYDLFLFPDLSFEDELMEETDIEVEEVYEEDRFPYYLIYIIIFILFILAFIMFYKLLKMPKEEKMQADRKDNGMEDDRQKEKEDEKTGSVEHGLSRDDIDMLMKIIEKHGGRTTQKEIRKEMPLSEAKISLLITELEHKGKIEKIKKGRGNILISK